ncbi:MAG: NPCBM/NEW2 domain-containing protein, partial [Chitinivibrionales bacterium]|nr:NPCBM/NEW2 domain-containing protein [Chitinivibrionales bacterium]
MWSITGKFILAAFVMSSLSVAPIPAEDIGTNLTDIEWLEAHCDQAEVQKNKNCDGGVLVVDGKSYRNGIGTHANSSITYSLKKACRRFTSKIGLDDAAGSAGSVAATYQIFGDGQKLYESAALTKNDPVMLLDISVTGVDVLELKVNSDNIDNVLADYIEPTLVADYPIHYAKYVKLRCLTFAGYNTICDETPFTAEERDRIRQTMTVFGDYVWRQTGMKLCIEWDYLEADISQAGIITDTENKIVNTNALNNYLIEKGYQKELDLVYFVGKNINFYGMSAYLLGKQRALCQTSILGSVYATIFSALNEEFNHAIDFLYGYWSDQYPHAHFEDQIERDEFLPNAGDHGDRNRAIYAYWDNWLGLVEKGHGVFAYALDSDADDMPDKEASVPLDEDRFKSLSTVADSDNDGLSDLEECRAGTLRMADPRNSDSDGDTKIDGDDEEPLDSIKTDVPYMASFSLSTPYDQMPYAGKFNVSNPTDCPEWRMAWNENYLYISVLLRDGAKKGGALLIDNNGDGLWTNEDNAEIRFSSDGAINRNVQFVCSHIRNAFFHKYRADGLVQFANETVIVQGQERAIIKFMLKRD